MLKNVQPYNGLSVTLPDNDTLHPSNQGQLQLSTNLSDAAQ